MWNVYFRMLALLSVAAGFPKELNVDEGEECLLKSGDKGVCTKITNCYSVMYDIDKNRIWPSICSVKYYNLIVCCESLEFVEDRINRNKKPMARPLSADIAVKEQSNINAPVIPPYTEVKKQPDIDETMALPSIPDEAVAKRPNTDVGRKAKQKCQEYSEWNDSPVLTVNSGKSIAECPINMETFIVGGEAAKENEFPHMAHLGYIDENNPSYQCGASLISDEYLLTAAHCLVTNHGPPKVAKLGSEGDEIIFKIKNITIHPNWSFSKNYDDIGLIRLEKNVTEFKADMRPACIQVERDIKAPEAVASGWGFTTYNGKQSEVLMKVNLPLTNHSECSKTYRKNRWSLDRGVEDDSMICAGNAKLKKDTCGGDSGGPLQIALQEPYCMYDILGVTSFGIQCGIAPGVYTRVSNYVSWIESIVWPDSEKSESNKIKA